MDGPTADLGDSDHQIARRHVLLRGTGDACRVGATRGLRRRRTSCHHPQCRRIPAGCDNQDFLLVVVSGLEAEAAPPTVRVITRPLRQLQPIRQRGHTRWRTSKRGARIQVRRHPLGHAHVQLTRVTFRSQRQSRRTGRRTSAAVRGSTASRVLRQHGLGPSRCRDATRVFVSSTVARYHQKIQSRNAAS